MTERKIEMRRHGPPRNSASAVSSITSTLPWAGETMTLGSEGTSGSGSRKNQRQNRENNIHSPNKKLAMPVRKVPTRIDAMPMTITHSSVTSVQKINFSAAWVALPLRFMAGIQEPHTFRVRVRLESGGGPPHCKTLARWPQSQTLPPGFGDAPVFPPSRRAIAPRRREGWRSPRRYRAIRRFMVLMHAEKQK